MGGTAHDAANAINWRVNGGSLWWEMFCFHSSFSLSRLCRSDDCPGLLDPDVAKRNCGEATQGHLLFLGVAAAEHRLHGLHMQIIFKYYHNVSLKLWRRWWSADQLNTRFIKNTEGQPIVGRIQGQRRIQSERGKTKISTWRRRIYYVTLEWPYTSRVKVLKG